jgi:uncharacterized protein (DUF736 family)
MAYELKNGSGTIFKNDKKGNEKAPEYRGEIKTPSGETFEISLWVKDGQKGKFFSVSVKEPYKKSSVIPEPPDTILPLSENDDLPF